MKFITSTRTAGVFACLIVLLTAALVLSSCAINQTGRVASVDDQESDSQVSVSEEMTTEETTKAQPDLEDLIKIALIDDGGGAFCILRYQRNYSV